MMPPTLSSTTEFPVKLLIDHSQSVKLDDAEFHPEQHLVFEAPSKVHTMKDLGLPEDTGISPVAVSEPFRLFSLEAVQRIRREILDESVVKNCKYSSNLANCQLRGFAAKLDHCFLTQPLLTNDEQVCSLRVRCLEASQDAGDHVQDCRRRLDNRHGRRDWPCQYLGHV